MTNHDQLNAWAAAHTALLVEGQSRLSDLVGTDRPDWELNLATGLLTLNGHRLTCALLGSVDEERNSWMWAWANPGLDHHTLAIQRASSLRRFGEEAGLWEFTEESFSMEGVLDLGMTPGATLALVASPQIMGGAIFSGLYPSGRLYLVVTDTRLTMEAPSAFTAPKAISGALAYGLGNHRDIVTVYAGAHGLEIEESASRVAIVFADASRLEIDFDDSDRIRHMHGVVPTGETVTSGEVVTSSELVTSGEVATTTEAAPLDQAVAENAPEGESAPADPPKSVELPE